MTEPSLPPPMEIDWQAVGTAIIYLILGAGAAVGAAWKKIKAPAPPTPPPPPTNGGALLPAVLSALQRASESVAQAEDAVRSVESTVADSQVSLGSQLGTLRDLLEDLRQHERKLSRIVARKE